MSDERRTRPPEGDLLAAQYADEANLCANNLRAWWQQQAPGDGLPFELSHAAIWLERMGKAIVRVANAKPLSPPTRATAQAGGGSEVGDLLDAVRATDLEIFGKQTADAMHSDDYAALLARHLGKLGLEVRAVGDRLDGAPQEERVEVYSEPVDKATVERLKKFQGRESPKEASPE